MMKKIGEKLGLGSLLCCGWYKHKGEEESEMCVERDR